MSTHECEQKDRIINMCETLARIDATVTALDKRINGNMDRMKDHMQNGSTWRVVWAGALVSILLAGVSGLMVYSHDKGIMEQRVSNLEKIKVQIRP